MYEDYFQHESIEHPEESIEKGTNLLFGEFISEIFMRYQPTDERFF